MCGECLPSRSVQADRSALAASTSRRRPSRGSGIGGGANAAIVYRPRIRGVFVRYMPTTINHWEAPVRARRRGERRL